MPQGPNRLLCEREEYKILKDRESDVLIVGGGVIGLMCAYFLLEKGRTVRILEAERIGNGSSKANCGLITPSHALPLAVPGMVKKALRWMMNSRSPFYIKPTLRPSTIRWFLKFASRCNLDDMRRSAQGRDALLRSSRTLYDDLIQQNDLQCDWEARGLLVVYSTEEEMRASDPLEEELAAFGVSSRTFHGDELVEFEPALRNDLYGGHFYDMDAHLRPDKMLVELSRVLRERGARIEENCGMEGVDAGPEGIDRVRTPSGIFRAGEYVFATGAWTPRLTRWLDLHVPIQPGKGYSITMDRPSICPTYPLLLKERNMAVTPWASGYRLGGTMEFSGYSDKISEGRISAILEGAGEYLREPVAPGEKESWTAWRPMTHDGLPYIGRSPRHRNLVVAAGHGMLGMSMGPATGKLVSEIVTRVMPHLDPTLYRLERV
jgi:D-amino-acid dehydrogenase